MTKKRFKGHRQQKNVNLVSILRVDMAGCRGTDGDRRKRFSELLQKLMDALFRHRLFGLLFALEILMSCKHSIVSRMPILSFVQYKFIFTEKKKTKNNEFQQALKLFGFYETIKLKFIFDLIKRVFKAMLTFDLVTLSDFQKF